MAWQYSQTTGAMKRNGKVQATGYSGAGAGRNNSSMQEVRNVGPIPQGEYVISRAYDTKSHGPHVMALTPCPGTEMFGRDEFLIHGDNPSHTASQGCIILARQARNAISSSGDTMLSVVP